eukprot:gene23374-30633_t
MVQNLDWLLYIVAFNPSRLSSSEFAYEAYQGVVGLLSVWHNRILEDADGWTRSSYRFYLEALEQVENIIELRAMHLDAQGKDLDTALNSLLCTKVETIIELRAMHLDALGKGSRYGP